MIVPDKEEFCKGVEEFKKREKRDAMYKVATFLVSHFWGKFSGGVMGSGLPLKGTASRHHHIYMFYES